MGEKGIERETLQATEAKEERESFPQVIFSMRGCFQHKHTYQRAQKCEKTRQVQKRKVHGNDRSCSSCHYSHCKRSIHTLEMGNYMRRTIRRMSVRMKSKKKQIATDKNTIAQYYNHVHWRKVRRAGQVHT